MPHELASLVFTIFWGYCSYMEFGYKYSAFCKVLPDHIERYGKKWEEDAIDLAAWGPIGLLGTFITGDYKCGRLYPWEQTP